MCSRPARRTADTEGPLKKSVGDRRDTPRWVKGIMGVGYEGPVNVPISRLLRRLCSLSLSKASPANTSSGLVPSGHLLVCTGIKTACVSWIFFSNDDSSKRSKF